MKILIKHYLKRVFKFKEIGILLLILYLVTSNLKGFFGLFSSILFPIIIGCYIVTTSENKEEEILFNTFPIKKEDIVISRYLFVFITTLSLITLTYLVSLIKGSIIISFRFDSFYVTFLAFIISMSIYIPFRFSEKIRLPKITSYILSLPFAYYLLLNLFKQRSYENSLETPFFYNLIVKFYKKKNNLISLTGTDYYKDILFDYLSLKVIGTVLIFIISMLISIRIYKRREFK